MIGHPQLLLSGLTVSVFFTVAYSTTEGMCRSKFGTYGPDKFNMHACAWCYSFITQSQDIQVHPLYHTLIVIGNQTGYTQYTLLIANDENSTLANRVCKTLSEETCSRWKSCCKDARACCRRQLLAPPGKNDSCPRTWDGYGCWDDTKPASTVYIGCPHFLKHSLSSRYAKKECTAKGHWYTLGNVTQENEWTDYTKCLDKDGALNKIYLAIACNIFSIVLLVPAILIFVLYRSLRRQHRIRLHINFFAALLFADVINILWEMLVTHEQLVSSGTFDSRTSCKLLSFLRLYSRNTTYVWMFCEGFYLHRLISNAFKPPKSLLLLYMIGWGFPFVYTSIYGLLRFVHEGESCWALIYGQLQWIFFVPNLCCLVVNFFFLCNILRILLTQLSSHPNEPSNFRRALKATFVLIPLFGVQLFVTMYRLPAGTSFATVYEKFNTCVLNSQGFFVALIFCFFNGEVRRLYGMGSPTHWRLLQHSHGTSSFLPNAPSPVITQMKRTCTRLRLLRTSNEAWRAQTTATSVHFVQQGPDSNESENGNLVGDSPKPSPGGNKKLYNSMELSERRYPYIPLAVRNPSQSPSPTEI